MNLINHIRTLKKITVQYVRMFVFSAITLLAFTAKAQTVHPVTASLQLIPPYSVYLPDYAAPGNDKLRVILTMNDLSQPSYTVRLRIKVELNGQLVMQTDPAYRPAGITLLPGVPQIISGAQLNEYLVSSHLQFSNGFNRDNYERTKALPEGAYRICVVAYDYSRADYVPVSNEGCNIFFFSKSEPPVLNYPQCNSRVERKDPQFLTFNWSMRNTPAVLAGAGGTGYRFELYEVRPAGSNPEYIVRSSTPVYTSNTDALMLVYGPAEPKLQDSMQYVWRVQAYDKDGRDAYQNNGYSPACVFTYGGNDPFAVNNIGKPALLGEALGERSGKWWWQVSNGSAVEAWHLQYRKQSATGKTDNYEWNDQTVNDTLLHLFNLEPDNAYEARVQARVRGIYGSWSETVVLRTLPKRVYECGKNDTAMLSQADAGQPLNTAVAGMLVRVGKFDMQLLQVTGGNGRFSGYGAVTTPLLGLNLNVKFTDVAINDKLQLTRGEVVALTEGIDAWIKDRTQVSQDVDQVKSWKENMPDFEKDSLSVIEDFARELLGISEGIWNDTYVFTEPERKDMQAALAEVKAAMQELEDADPSNDAAAEKKLRQALKKAQPLLEKLSENIGKGVLVKLGLVKEKLIKDALSDINKLVEAELQKLAFEDARQQNEWLAKNGPNAWEGEENAEDKEYLQAKKQMIQKLLTEEAFRNLFAAKIAESKEDDSYLNEQESVLKKLLEKEDNNTRDSKELLDAANWNKVKVIIEKYLDIQVKAALFSKGSKVLLESSLTAGMDKELLSPTQAYYLTPAGTPVNLQDFDGIISIAKYNQAPLYVVTGLSLFNANKGRIYYSARVNARDVFIGYINDKDSTDIFDLSAYRVKLSSCNAILPYALDDCTYKVLALNKWEVPDDKTVNEVQQLLSQSVATIRTADKSMALSLASYTVDGQILPLCSTVTHAYDNMPGIHAANPRLIVMAPSLSNQQELREALSRIGIKADSYGGYYFDQIILSDGKITTEQASALDKYVETQIANNKNYRILWIQLDGQGKFKDVYTYYSKDVDEEVKLILDAYRDYIDDIGKRDDWKKFVDHITDAFKQLADFIRKVKVPEKYYNPLAQGYDSDSFILYLFKQATKASLNMGGIGPLLKVAPGINGKLTDKIGEAEIDFAFYCGVWNGLVEQIATLPEGAGWLLNMVTDKDHARQEFVVAIKGLNKQAEKAGGYCKLLGQILDSSFNGSNPALSAHSYGVGTSQALTFFLAVAKVGQATKIVTLLNKLDVVGGLVGLTLSPVVKVMGAATKLVLRQGGKVAVRILKDGVDIAAAFIKAKSSFSSGGRLYAVWVPFLPNMRAAGEEFIKKIKAIRIVKDASGKILTDNEGRVIVEALYDDAGVESTMHAVAKEVEQGTDDVVEEVIDMAKAEERYAKQYVSAKDKPFGLQMTIDEVARMFGENGKKLVLQMEAKAKELLAKAGNLGPVLSGIIDTKTGQIFYGQNLLDQEIRKFIDELHPVLKKRLEIHLARLEEGTVNAAVTDIERASIPGSHSEIVALDKAIKARGAGFKEKDLEEFLLHNKKLGGQVDAAGVPIGCPPRCVNCWHLTDGIKVIGND